MRNNKRIRVIAIILVIAMVVLTIASFGMLAVTTVFGAETGSVSVVSYNGTNAASGSQQAESQTTADTADASAASGKSANSNLTLEQGLNKLKNILETISAEYKDNISYDTLIENAINGVFDGLDPYSEYYPTQDGEETLINLVNNSYQGIGVTITLDNGKFFITQVTMGGPSEEAGLKAGDEITAVDGVSTNGWTLEQLTGAVRGEADTTVNVTIKRSGTTQTYTVKRANLAGLSVYSGEITDTTLGYIKIDTFSANALLQYKEALEDLTEKGVTGLIVDIRNNGGGYMQAAYLISSAMLKKDSTVYNLWRRGEKISTATTMFEGDYTTPMVLLVNEYSASASEIFAGAMQDNNRAKLVGVTTYGKGIAQEVFSIKDSESEFKLSTEYFTTPLDHVINETGITPDYIVENYTENNVDDLIAEATSYAPMCEDVKYYSGMTGLNVYGAQQRLEFLGYLKPNTAAEETEIDLLTGTMDEETVKAITKFQSNQGLYPYGALDYTTMETLETAVVEAISDASVTTTGEDAQLRKGIELLQ